MTLPVEVQILDAVQALLLSANTDAGQGVHQSRGDADPFATTDLPAINLLLLSDEVETPSVMGGGLGVPVLQLHNLELIVQVISAATSGAERQARIIASQVQTALLQDPTLGGICSSAITLKARQWIRDENPEFPLARQNNLYKCAFSTYAHAPNISI
jgi:hypothetical protein